MSRRLATILCAAVLALSAGLLMAEPSGPDHDLYNRGRTLIFEENWSKARNVFESLARRHPRSPFLDDALYWTAFSLFEEGKPRVAYRTLQTLLGSYPESPWTVDARSLMVRCADSELKKNPAGGTLAAKAASAAAKTEYRQFLEESTRDSNTQVSLLAIDTLLIDNPQNAPDLLNRVVASGSDEGAEVLMDRFFGNEQVKVAFEDPAAGFTAGNVTVLVRLGNQSINLRLDEALDAASGRGSRRLPAQVRREIREGILEAERSLIRQAPARDGSAEESGAMRRATIMRVVDGEIHYYENGSETVKIWVRKHSDGFKAENIQIVVEKGGSSREIRFADVTGTTPGPSARGLSNDTLTFLTHTLRVIELDLTNPSR